MKTGLIVVYSVLAAALVSSCFSKPDPFAAGDGSGGDPVAAGDLVAVGDLAAELIDGRLDAADDAPGDGAGNPETADVGPMTDVGPDAIADTGRDLEDTLAEDILETNEVVEADVCQPQCQDEECGPDGCGGNCGECEDDEVCLESSGDCELDYCKWGLSTPGCCADDIVYRCVAGELEKEDCKQNPEEQGACGWDETKQQFGCVSPDGPPPPADAPPVFCCQPTCQPGQLCGDSGCWEPCGECEVGLMCDAEFQCVCKPDCDDKECGDDGCGGNCGECIGSAAECDEGECQCQNLCDPETHACGDDGCGGSCGTCDDNEECIEFVCECFADCTGKVCGSDGCTGTCGECDGNLAECVDGQCQCDPVCDGLECGDDGCGDLCGSCDCGEDCVDGTCIPNKCDGKACGDDGCGSTCGECTGDNETCENFQCICNPICLDVLANQPFYCGDDGCGESCPCADGSKCMEQVCAVFAADCVNVPEATPCYDNDPCTPTGLCEGAACKVAEDPCNDADVCTIDSCDNEKGECVHESIAAQCVLEPDNPCMLYDCHPVEGCTEEALDQVPCADGDPCTSGDACQQGTCVGQEDQSGCDFDHDGLINEVEDLCDYAFDPQNPDVNGIDGADACEQLEAHGAFALSRPISLAVPGGAMARRTNEPVEIPLANGLLDSSVVGYWRVAKGQAADLTGNGNDGVLTFVTTTDSPLDGADGALLFSGIGTVAVLADDAGPGNGALLEKFTISLWFRPDSVGGDLQYLWYDASAAGDNVLAITPNGNLSFTMAIENGQVSVVCGQPTADTWHHASVTFDGAVFACGLDGQFSEFMSAQSPAAGTTGTSLGNTPVTKKWPFKGAMDDVILFERALSKNELDVYYHSSASYGTSFVPGAQPDHDDVRLTETTGDQEEGLVFVKRSRVFGVLPHSDSDAKGVAGYWRMDGDGKASMGGVELDGATASATAVKGRFGDPGGALRFATNADALVVPDHDDLEFEATESFTVETWIRMENPDNLLSMVLRKRLDTSSIFYQMPISGGRIHCELSGGAPLYYKADTLINDGHWHHVACVLNREAGRAQVYVDGLLDKSLPIPVGFNQPIANAGPLTVGTTNENPKAHNLNVDELLIHTVAKSADYLYHRARPGIPKLRFLANTQLGPTDGEFPVRSYDLHWGNPTATANPAAITSLDQAQPLCPGLLNHCLGYAGWWRFDDAGLPMAVDSATAKNNGAFLATPQYQAGQVGSALVFDGTNQVVAVDSTASLESPLEGLTLEVVAAFQGSSPAAGAHLASKAYCDEGVHAQSYTLGGTDAFAEEWAEQKSGWLGLATAVAGYEFWFAPEDSLIWDGSFETLAAVYDPPGVDLFVNQVTKIAAKEGAVQYDGGKLTIGAMTYGCDPVQDTYKGHFAGAIDSVRIMNRALMPDEFLQYPPMSHAYDPLDIDQDGDGVPESGFAEPCSGGQSFGCNDNCPTLWNPGQEDSNGCGAGDACC